MAISNRSASKILLSTWDKMFLMQYLNDHFLWLRNLNISINIRNFKGRETVPVVAPIRMRINPNYLLPVSFLSLAAAVVGAGSGQLDTASSTSSRKVVLLCTVVDPRTTLTPGEMALTWATIFASS